MDEDGEFLRCIREVEEDMDEGTANGQRRSWRKLGIHLMRLHREIADLRAAIHKMIEEHTVDGEPIDIKSSYRML